MLKTISALLVIVLSVWTTPAVAVNLPSDLNSSCEWAKGSITHMYEQGILHGDPNGRFNPHNVVTRAQMITVIVGALGLNTDQIPAKPTFKDIPATHWAYRAVETAYKNGIVSGVGPSSFGPNQICTREQVAVMLVRSLKLNSKQINDSLGRYNYMQDLPVIAKWAKPSVVFCMYYGLMNGTGTASGAPIFDPKGPATREQMAVMMDNFITKRPQVMEAVNIVFDDWHVEAAVRVALGNAEGYLTKSQMEKIISLSFTGANNSLSSLRGLEYCTNLQRLSITGQTIPGQELTDLSPLRGLTKLTELHIYQVKDAKFDFLKNLTNLNNISICNSRITDLSPLKGLSNLMELDLVNCQLEDIDALKTLTKIVDLSLNNNNLTDISPVARLTNLTTLNLSDNQISNISALSGLAKLQNLNLSENKVGDLSVLKKLPRLTGLQMANNQISDVSLLSSLTNLGALDLDYNRIVDPSPLSKLINLASLELRYNLIEDASSLKALKGTWIYLDGNPCSKGFD